MTDHRLRVSFIGLGYVGLCTAVTFATRGFETLGVEVDSEKLSLIESARAPIHEPQLDRLLGNALRSGRLKVTKELSSVAATDVIFITVGTPIQADGSINLRYVEEATRELGQALRSERDYRLAVVKSTVTPGPPRTRVRPILE